MAETTAYDFTLTGIDGKPMPLAQFKGHPVLVVNTASECGYTPQYEELEELWQAYKDKGLVIVGVPSNDFGGQEPGTASEIATFCKVNYGVTFPLADKTVVKGDRRAPVLQVGGRAGGHAGPAQVELPQIPDRRRRPLHRLVLDADQAHGPEDQGGGGKGAGGAIDWHVLTRQATLAIS